jgi:hypothetical protein
LLKTPLDTKEAALQAALAGLQTGDQRAAAKRERPHMRLGFYGCSAVFVLNLCASNGVMAQGLTPFRYEAQAQRHCPDDAVVWLDFRRERYYTKGQRRYAVGLTGSFVCRNEARNHAYRRSPLGLR